MMVGADPSTARKRLHDLLRDVSSGRLSIEAFCSQFETTYNLEIDKRQLTAEEAEAFSMLFEQVVWYSPFPEERAKVPNYKDEKEILDAVSDAERILGRSARMS